MVRTSFLLLFTLASSDLGFSSAFCPSLQLGNQGVLSFRGRALLSGAEARGSWRPLPRCKPTPLGLKALDYVSIFKGSQFNDEQLPAGLTDSFEKWIVSNGELRPIFNSDSKGEESGWVNPFSYEETWLPADLPRPTLKPAISAIIKGGEIRYLMPALDVNIQAGGKLWWNRGMNSFPLASRWMELTSADLRKLRVVAFSQAGHIEATMATRELDEDNQDNIPEPDLGPWSKLWDEAASQTILNLVEVVAGEEGEKIESGYHHVVVPIDGASLQDSPEAGTRLKVLMTSEEEIPADGLDDSCNGAEMDILFRAAVAGGSSEYLPEVYKELYLGINQ